MNRAVIFPAAVVLALAIAVAAHAQTPDVPPAAPAVAAAPAPETGELPSICTDRPTKSNYACVVEPGHFQYEADIVNGAFLRLNGTTTDTYLATNPTFKYGLAKNFDVEANIVPYEVIRTHSTGSTSTLEGVGDLYLRLKWNFLTTTDGKLQITALPYIKAPTARLGIGNGEVEGGLLLPVNYKLTDKITLTSVPEVDDFKDAAGSGRHVNTVQLINIGYSLPYNLTAYGELWGDWNFDPAGTVRQYSADVALAWGVTKYLQLDGGLNFGLNRYTPGVQAYVGISQKF